MKYSFVAALLLSAFLSVQAFAQTTPTTDAPPSRRAQLANTTPEQRANGQTAQMKARLSLTAEQEPTVAAINLNYARQAQSLMETGGRNRQTMKQARELVNSKNDELKKVLNQDQYKQYEAFRDEQKDRIKQGRGLRGNR